jgi:hypothetical protein
MGQHDDTKMGGRMHLLRKAQLTFVGANLKSSVGSTADGSDFGEDDGFIDFDNRGGVIDFAYVKWHEIVHNDGGAQEDIDRCCLPRYSALKCS